MNILHTVFSFNNGGIENLLVDIINNWDESNKIILCVINDDYNEELLRKVVKRKNIKVILLNRKKGTRSMVFLYKYIKIIYKERITIIHCHSIQSLRVGLISKMLKPTLKIYYTVHDTKIYKKLSKINIILQNIFVEKVIAISKAVRNDIESRNSKNDIEVIYNAIDLKKFKKKRENKNYGRINIGCIARIIPEKKGQDILLKAIRIVKDKYPNVMCLFAGEPPKGKEYILGQLENQAIELGVAENVRFEGNINDIPNFLNKLDIFVLPSRYEGFGIVLLEAMASNIPVIASNLEGPQEIIKENKYGELFEVENYKELAELIINKIENNDIDKINNSYDYVKEKFSIEIVNKKLKEIYD